MSWKMNKFCIKCGINLDDLHDILNDNFDDEEEEEPNRIRASNRRENWKNER